MMGGVTLGQLIAVLTAEAAKDPGRKPAIGFSNPHSYRGSYDELAFEPDPTVTVGEMYEAAMEANGSVYRGWKGGDYRMTDHTPVNLAMVGCCGEDLGPILLSLMLGTEINWAELRR
jgi:hypothetical protein